MDQMHKMANLEEVGSPAWVNDVTEEPSHSGESPLFTQKLLAASRVEQKFEQQFPLQFNKKPIHSKTPRAASASYYRPNSAHRYLSATSQEVVDGLSEADSETHLGRPTRTTLLRARQRCNSAPVNAYQARRELQKKNEEKLELKRNLYNNVGNNMRDMMSTPSNDGESMHSFLVGARYNRANCVDAKGLSDFGVYMARNNPLNCFLADSRKPPSQDITHYEDDKPEPQNPPSSPESLNSTGSTDRSASPSPPVTPTHSQPPHHIVHAPQQAWMQVSSSRIQRQESAAKSRRPTSSVGDRGHHIINLNNELNVKDLGHRCKRTRTPFAGIRRPSSAHATYRFCKGLPSVYIQGTAIACTEAPLGRRAPSRNSSSLSLASSSSAPIASSRSSQSYGRNTPNIMGRPLSRGHEQFARGHEVEALILARKALQLGLSNVGSVAVPVNEQDGYISPVNSPSVENVQHFDFYPEPTMEQSPTDIESNEALIKSEEINPPICNKVEEDATELPPHEMEILSLDDKQDNKDMHRAMKSPTGLEERPKSRVRFKDEVEEGPISEIFNENEVFFITEDEDDGNVNQEPNMAEHIDMDKNIEESQMVGNVISEIDSVVKPTSHNDDLELDDDNELEIPPHELYEMNIPANKPYVEDVHYETSCPQLFESELVVLQDEDADYN